MADAERVPKRQRQEGPDGLSAIVSATDPTKNPNAASPENGNNASVAAAGVCTAPCRLDKFLADCNVGPRNRVLELWAAGKAAMHYGISCGPNKPVVQVSVNGKQLTLNTIIDPARDVILVDGRSLQLQRRAIYALLNKPMGCTTTMAMGQEHSVAALLPPGEGQSQPGHGIGLIHRTQNGADWPGQWGGSTEIPQELS